MQRFARLPRRHVWAEFKTTVFDDRVHERIPVFDSHNGAVRDSDPGGGSKWSKSSATPLMFNTPARVA